jgi:DNA-binding CsgD family transcriptional regulator
MRELTPMFGSLGSRFVALSSFLGRAQFRRTQVYNQYFRHRDVEDVAVLPAMLRIGELASFVSIDRDRDFYSRDLDVLNAVAGPLQAAFVNGANLTEVEKERGLLKSTLESAGWNGLVVDHRERICLESSQARELLAFYFGREGLGYRLPDSVLRWMRVSAQRLRRPSTVPPQVPPYRIARGARQLEVRLMLHPNGCMLLLEENFEGVNISKLQALGLTKRQAEILSYIAMGKTNGEIGIILGTSRRTVEKHVEQVFDRLGVETRTAAAAVAIGAPAKVQSLGETC